MQSFYCFSALCLSNPGVINNKFNFGFIILKVCSLLHQLYLVNLYYIILVVNVVTLLN